MNPKLNVNVSMKYPDSHTPFILASKKNGSSIPQFLETMHLAGYHFLEPENLVNLYIRGDIDHNITSLRKVFENTKGVWGLSKTGALRCYKLIYSKLPASVARRPTYDGFTKQELGE